MTRFLSAWVLVPLALLMSPARADFADLFERVSPSVVVIHTFEREAEQSKGLKKQVKQSGLGSGVLISGDGLVLTASHVVQTADALNVEFKDGESVRARVVASEPAADLALLLLERVPAGAPFVKLGDSDRVRVGEQVCVIGAPYGESQTLTVGYISARRDRSEVLGGLVSTEFFQTDAAINKGNSGGPLFNAAGEVIGVVSHIASRSGGSEGLGFAVTANTARHLLLEEKSFWSGLEGVVLGPGMSAILNLPTVGGFLVQRVADNSPGAALGLRGGDIPAEIRGEKMMLGGDIVMSVMGEAVGGKGSYQRIKEKLAQIGAGDTLRVTVLRAGQMIELTRVAHVREN